MPSFADSIFLFILALLLFGPKKLPVLARELGKWMGEFRRASNEFKMQMEDELRASEQAERQKQISAMEAAAPIPPPLDEPAEPEHPHMRYSAAAEPDPVPVPDPQNTILPPQPSLDAPAEHASDVENSPPPVDAGAQPLPIATSGNLKMMPPPTGLPAPRSRGGNGALSTLVESIPEASSTPAATPEPESIAHGD